VEGGAGSWLLLGFSRCGWWLKGKCSGGRGREADGLAER
jgi:hypothetical protein